MHFLPIAFLATLLGSVSAKTHEYWWKAEWSKANPDGLYERDVVTCNGTFPWPDIRVTKGDRVIVHLINGLSQNASLHFHGLYQWGTSNMDGVPMVSQCQIAPNDSMIYNFTTPNQVGTYWYHSHSAGQYMDGMRGTFIIEEEDDDDYPFDFDEDVLLKVSDWYHKDVLTLTDTFMNLYNPTGAEPVPQVLLLNDTLNASIHVKPNTTYLFRVINIGGFLSDYFWIDQHNMTVVAVDGVYVEPNETEYLYLAVAQRYDVLVKTKEDASENFAIMLNMDGDMPDTDADIIVQNNTNTLVYNDSAPLITEQVYSDNVIDDFLNDFYLVNYKKQELLEDYDYRIELDLVMDNLIDGKNYAFLDNITYIQPKVPTIGTVFSSNASTNALIYGSNTHTFVLQKDEIVEIVINNNDTGKHAFHLHGHEYQVVERGVDQTDAPGPVPFNDSAPYDPPQYPLIRDVFQVHPQSYMRIRFKATNPGVWVYHCHVEWHLIQGLLIQFVEDPESIVSQQTLGDDWKATCDYVGTSYVGNAAGNTEDYTDLSGEPVQVASIPGGMTARGIVALVFSCVSAFLGMFAICWYGMADIPDLNEQVFDDLDVEDGEDDDTEAKSATGDSSGNAAGTGTSGSSDLEKELANATAATATGAVAQ